MTRTTVVLAVVCLDCNHLVRLADWRTMPEGEPQPCANAACPSHTPKPTRKRPYYEKDHEYTCAGCSAAFMSRARPAGQVRHFCSRKCRNTCVVYAPPAAHQ